MTSAFFDYSRAFGPLQVQAGLCYVYSGAQRMMRYNGNSVSSVTLSVRYRFNTTNSKYKGTGTGQSQKNRM